MHAKEKKMDPPIAELDQAEPNRKSVKVLAWLAWPISYDTPLSLFSLTLFSLLLMNLSPISVFNLMECPMQESRFTLSNKNIWILYWHTLGWFIMV